MATKRTIGATIALDGEANFKKSVSACTASLKTMRSELSLVEAQYEGNANSLEALQAKHDALAKTLDASNKVVTETASALENAQKNYSEAGKQIEEYKNALAEAEKQLTAMQESGTATEEEIANQSAKIEELNRIVTKGEKEYESAGKNIETWQQKLNAAKLDVIQLNRQLDENDKYLDEASNSADGCATSIDEFGKKVKQSTKDASDAVEDFSEDVAVYFTADKIIDYANQVSDAFATVVNSAYEATKAIDEGYDTIIERTGATGQQLAQFQQIADNIYGDLPMDMSEIGSAIGELNTRFGLQGEELEDLSTKFLKFSKLNKTDVATSVDTLQNVMSAFGLSTSDASKFLDVLNNVGQRTGADISKLSSSLLTNASALQEMGMDAYQATTFMGQLETAGVDTETAISGLKRAYTTAIKDGKDFSSELYDIQDELLNNTDAASASSHAYDLFGKSVTSIISAVKKGQISFTDIADSMDILNESAGSVDKTFGATEDTWDSMEVALNNLKMAGGDLVTDVLTEFEPAIEGVVDVIKDVREWLDGLPTPLRRTVSTVALLTAGLGVLAPKMLAVYTAYNAFKQAGTISKNITDLADAFGKLGKTSDAVESVSEAVEGLGDASKVIDSVDDVTDSMDALTGTASAGAEAVEGMRGGLSTFASNAGGIVAGVGIATLACVALANAIKAVDEASKDDAAISGYIDATEAATKASQGLLDGVSNSINDYQANLASLEIQSQMASGIVSELDKLASTTNKTSGQMQVQQAYVDRLNKIYPDLNLAIDKNTGVMTANGQIVKNLSQYMKDYEASLKNIVDNNMTDNLVEQYTQIASQIQVNDANIEANTKKVNELFEILTGKSRGDMSALDILPMAFKYIGSTLSGIGDASESTAGEISALNEESGELSDTNKQLQRQLDAVNEAYFNITGTYLNTEDALAGLTEATDEQGIAVAQSMPITQSAATKYMDLAQRIKDFGGDLEAVGASFTEEETDLQELFNKTSVAWQESHDKITSGLSSEIASLDVASSNWDDYKKSVLDSLQSVSSRFTEVNSTEGVTWDSMIDTLNNNSVAYEKWNADVSRVLESARYQNDETFREIANSIMLGGIDSASYLDEFVNSVNLSTTEASDDLQAFAMNTSATDNYATMMANLQTATENGMGAIASAYRDTTSEATQSIQALSDAMSEQAEVYNQFTENAQNIVESEKYKSDEAFREYANQLLSQGTSASGEIANLWQTMQEDALNGTQNVDEAVNSYTELKQAQENYANAFASIETATQDGMDNTVSIIDNAGEAWSLAAQNDSALLADGLNMQAFIDKMTDGALSATESLTGTLRSDQTMSELANVGQSWGSVVMNSFWNQVQSGIGSMLQSNTASLVQQSSATAGATAGRNDGGITVNVNGTQGQDVKELANAVLDRMNMLFVR